MHASSGKAILATLLAFSILGITGSARAQDDQWFNCGLTGTSYAEEVNDPLGRYLYTIEIDWDTGIPRDQSHITIGLTFDLETCPCGCEFSFGVEDTTGYSTGVNGDDPCLAYYGAEFSCPGDPSVEGYDDPVVKFEPVAGDCEPAPSGEGLFWFYSDWPPVPVETPNTLLVMKFDGSQCGGGLVGVLPGCDCQAIATESSTWGRIKSLYR